MTHKAMLAVSETFGPTIQGEGPDMGKPCVFLRLAGCAVQCGWCDTAYTWERGFAYTMLSAHMIARKLFALANGAPPVRRLVISGGEPMQQQRGLQTLLDAFRKDPSGALFDVIEIETSGTVAPTLHESGNRIVYNVSPKLAHAQARVPYDIDILHEYVVLGGRFKFVVQARTDFIELDDIAKRAGIPPSRIWVMPLGTERHVIAVRGQELASEAIERGYNVTTRLHIILFGNKRGV